MDDRRFDDVSRALAAGASRRQTLKALLGGSAAGLAVLLGRREAAAGPNRGVSRSACCTVGPRCRPGLECFRGICTVGSAVDQGTAVSDIGANVAADVDRRVSRGFPDSPCRTTRRACGGALDCVQGVCRVTSDSGGEPQP